MKNIIIFSVLCLTALLSGCRSYSPCDYVDPNIGSVAPLLTTVPPQVHRPHSMVRLFPVTEPGLNDRYFSDRFYGVILNMPKYRLGYTSSIMPTSGNLTFDHKASSSWYDHDIEEVHPWHHSVWLQDFGIQAEWTATERTSYYMFDYTRDDSSNILFRIGAYGEISIEGNNVICGWESVDYARQYFYAVADEDFWKAGIMEGGTAYDKSEAKGGNIGAWISYEGKGTRGIRIGISYISIEQAKANLEKENIGRRFDELTAESRAQWEKSLGRIEVTGGTEKEKRLFYTCLYRTEERMVCQSEGGRYYSGFDRQVHEDSRPFYNDDWVWDTYRNLHALGFILDPDRKADEMQSYARMYEQWGWVPQFPELTEWDGPYFRNSSRDWHSEPMIGNHVASVVAEAIRKGVTDFDVEKIYEGLRKNSLEGTMIPWRAGKGKVLDTFYQENGYFPGLAPGESEPYDYIDDSWEKRQSVSVTLEHSYDDWCLAGIARYLGKEEDYRLFMKRSLNYLNLWNPATGFFAPKDIEGNWIDPFDPMLCNGYGARSYFAEVNAYVHAFHVQHDIPELIELMGGNEAFIERLDDAFTSPTGTDKWRFMGMMPDATGLQGLIPTGNEPSFHIPWLYNYAGAPWKTQHRVRQIAEIWYDDEPTGLSGDEDGGALCAWYVFAAMGFYPVNPVSGEYAISSPIFRKTVIRLSDGMKFIIKAPEASKRNKYIKEARLNGKRLTRPFITHEDIISGGILELELTDKPVYDCFEQ